MAFLLKDLLKQEIDYQSYRFTNLPFFFSDSKLNLLVLTLMPMPEFFVHD